MLWLDRLWSPEGWSENIMAALLLSSYCSMIGFLVVRIPISSNRLFSQIASCAAALVCIRLCHDDTGPRLLQSHWTHNLLYFFSCPDLVLQSKLAFTQHLRHGLGARILCLEESLIDSTPVLFWLFVMWEFACKKCAATICSPVPSTYLLD